MRHLFVNDPPRLFASWQEAFPTAVLAGPQQIEECRSGTLWLRSTAGSELNSTLPAWRQINQQLPLVVLADEPTETGAFQAIALGAAGYCNSHAAPEVLRSVAEAVNAGRLWLGQSMLRRLLSTLSSRLASRQGIVELFPANDSALAQLLIEGANHAEIAAALAIPETSVSDLIGALLARAGVQDRLQLLLKAGAAA